jgi:hypothetical protein
MTRRRTIQVLIALTAAVAACTAPVGEDDADTAEGNVSEGAALDGHYTGIWTNWYRHEFDLEKQKAEGLLKLLSMRQALTKENLFDRQVPRTIDCKGAETRRTADGTCNDLARPWAGAAGARFGRNTDPEKSVSDTDEKAILTPNPRQISKELLSRDLDGGGKPKVKEVDFLNLTAASWIQFQTHDWFAHPQQATQVYKVAFGGDTSSRTTARTGGMARRSTEAMKRPRDAFARPPAGS